MRGGGFLSSTLLALVALVACVSPTGGWDSASFVALHPEIAEIRGQRIGDLTPYPAIVDGQVAMVTCRFVAEGRPIPIAVSGEGWPATWGERALEAVEVLGAHRVLAAELGLQGRRVLGLEEDV